MSGTAFPQTKPILPNGDFSTPWRMFLQNLYQISGGSNTVLASSVQNVPNGTITQPDVQGALNQLDTLKVPKTTTVNGKALNANISLTSSDVGAVSTASLGTGVSAFLTTPTSANLAGALTDETGSGSVVFGANPTIANPVLTSTVYIQQGAPASYGVASTLTASDMLGGIVQYTGAAAALTLPLGTDMDAGVVVGLAVDRAFEVCFINTGSGAATVTANTGFTIVGSATVTNGSSARYRCRRSAANTYIAYRVT